MITRYSQLYFAAATKDQILAVSKKLGKSPEEITQLTSEVDPTKKYEVWLLKQMAFQNIRLPEDAERVQQTLQKFEQLNQHKQLQFQNINQYKTIMELEVEIKNKIPKELGENYDYRLQEYMKLPGVELYGQNSDYLILEVSNPESLTELGQETGWCTKHLKWATHYIVEEGNKQYVVFKKENGKYLKFAQFAEDFSQFKNLDDHEMTEIDDSLFELVTSKLKAPASFMRRNLSKLFEWLETNKVVKGVLDLQSTPITSLPAGLSVSGRLDLSNTPITSLPEDLSVGGSLELYNTNITSLPAGLSVGRDLDLRNTKITSLPAGLSVGGYLYLSNTPITSLPADLSVGGSLYLRNTKITSLPGDLSVGGGLYLSNTQITSLPAGLSVGRDLDLRNTKITSLPGDLSVGGGLYGINPKTKRRYQDEYNEIVRRRGKTSGIRKLKLR